jgi:hypothetical protein
MHGSYNECSAKKRAQLLNLVRVFRYIKAEALTDAISMKQSSRPNE